MTQRRQVLQFSSNQRFGGATASGRGSGGLEEGIIRYMSMENTNPTPFDASWLSLPGSPLHGTCKMNDTLRQVMEQSIAASETGALPPIPSIVQEARRTVKSYPEVPGRPDADVERVDRMRGWRVRMQEMEKDLEAAVSSAEKQAEDSLEEYRSRIEAASTVEECRSELASLKEEGIEMYLQGVADRNGQLAQIRHEKRLRRLLERQFSLDHFHWFQLTQRVQPILLRDGYSTNSRWRSRVRTILLQVDDIIRRAESEGGLGMSKESRESVMLRELARDMNAFGSHEHLKKLQEVESMLLEREVKRFPEYKVLKDKADDADKRWAAANSSKSPSRQISEQLSIRKFELSTLLEKSEKQAEKMSEVGTRSKFERPSREDPFPEMMRILSLKGITRDSEEEVKAGYQKALAHCSREGNWRGAFEVYKTLADRGIPPTFPATYMLILAACKRASPPAGHAVIPLLEEVEASGFVLTRELYHAGLEVCRAGGQWRRALMIFNRMGNQGIPPTTHTYALLEKAGASADQADPVEVYQGLKYAGVPAYLSYTAAVANAVNRQPEDKGPLAELLGSDVLPSTIPNQAARADALANGRPAIEGNPLFVEDRRTRTLRIASPKKRNPKGQGQGKTQKR